ncbi:glycosyltransferase family 4 protein [Patescibacteria group bacterium]|nr:glycosyltransferase family 4 protein [Patescibacteria group bacterium]MDE1946799.1 glycosyltransferase family 4 protein [Patescibacteria group bacterium]MDE2011137.1 glycosyltransferase family 4 protein [Patescibacteria group bacterium]MDE2233046.1 glycosyltransferase family 4 protein [Patescibacteria group bacterium]
MNNASKKLLMISSDRDIFREDSAVRARQAEYAKNYDEVHIVVFEKRNSRRTPPPPSQVPLSVKRGDPPIGGECETLCRAEEGEAADADALSNNCFAYSTRSWSKFLYPLDAIRLGRFIVDRRHIDEVTCQDSVAAVAGISLKKQFDIQLEIQVHEDIGSPYYATNVMRKIRKYLYLSYLPKADKIRVVSDRIRLYLIDAFGRNSEAGGINDPELASKIEVRPIAVDVEKIKSAPILEGADLRRKYPQFEKIVLMASRLEKEKNIELAIHSWKKVVEKIPRAGLIIVGRGSLLANLKSSTINLGLVDSVIFENWIDRPTLFSYYKTADLLLNTSLFEGYGMALVEAKAAGCRIVSTDVGVAKEVGAEIVGRDEKAVTNAIILILEKL